MVPFDAPKQGIQIPDVRNIIPNGVGRAQTQGKIADSERAGVRRIGTKTAFDGLRNFQSTFQQEYQMAKTVADVMKMVKENEVKFV
ncbi:MAG: hypothetical protein VW687_10215, partial [Curvibacter sp.]